MSEGYGLHFVRYELMRTRFSVGKEKHFGQTWNGVCIYNLVAVAVEQNTYVMVDNGIYQSYNDLFLNDVWTFAGPEWAAAAEVRCLEVASMWTKKKKRPSSSPKLVPRKKDNYMLFGLGDSLKHMNRGVSRRMSSRCGPHSCACKNAVAEGWLPSLEYRQDSPRSNINYVSGFCECNWTEGSDLNILRRMIGNL